METGSTQPRRVAVIVVHGVADQQPGATARSVAELLVAAAPKGKAYSAVATNSFTLEVDPLAPQGAKRLDAVPVPEATTIAKAFRQSFRSDFQQPQWKRPEPSSAQGNPDAVSAAPPEHHHHARGNADRGIATTNYLLTKYRDNGAPREAYRSDCVTLARTADDVTEHTDVYEMYWADLSRLSGAIPRIVTELFTMVFRLSKLGRGTVDEARRNVRSRSKRRSTSWDVVTGSQIALDWAFVNLLALLFAQLGMVALAIAPFALLADQPGTVRTAGGVGLSVFGLLWWGYRRRDVTSKWLLPATVVVGALCSLLYAPSAFWIVGFAWFTVLTWAYAALLRISDDRFPFTRFMGLLLWGIVLALMTARALWQTHCAGYDCQLTTLTQPTPALWAQVGLFVVEVTLRAIEWWWVLAVPILLVWLVSGIAAARHKGYEASASVATGRLGFFVSLTAFVVLTMAIWALANTALQVMAAKVHYDAPYTFPADEIKNKKSNAAREAENCDCRAKPAADAASAAAPALPTKASEPSSAQLFLTARYEDTTSYFAVLATLLLSFGLFVIAVFLPSVLAELKLLAMRVRAGASRSTARAAPKVPARTSAEAAEIDASALRLGRWLTAGYRNLDRAVLIIVIVSVALALVVGLNLWPYGPTVLRDYIPATARGCIAWLSEAALRPLVLGAAGFIAAVSALGGVLSRTIPSLRAPLDIALDVDNHFREFPRHSIPRARIFSRYRALLKHLTDEGYDRFVIVAHSQGTVISAELLRFLSDAGPASEEASRSTRRERLRKLVGADVRILTVGCPLRQLYAARFPSLYGWVLAYRPTGNGPSAEDIGAEVWANAFTSGDYVGRWLWTSPPSAKDTLAHPMVDTVAKRPQGRLDVYSPFDEMPPTDGSLDAAREFELCLGLGAHTHYFEPDQAKVAWLIDHLISSDTRPDPTP